MCIHLISVNLPAILGHLVTSKPVAESVNRSFQKTLTLPNLAFWRPPETTVGLVAAVMKVFQIASPGAPVVKTLCFQYRGHVF